MPCMMMLHNGAELLLILAPVFTVVIGKPFTKSAFTPLPGRGPRVEFNETGTFLYKHDLHPDQQLLCKKCSREALSDSSFMSQQQPACIGLNFNKSNLKELAPYCNVGEDLGCGLPMFNHTNSHLVCDPGYSNKTYSVYSTCSLVCNNTQNTIGQLYCRESLEWHIDLTSKENCNGCGRPIFNHTNSHLVCGPGYSNNIYSVNSTCSLVCNITQTTIGQLHCRESLDWHIDWSSEEDCKGPMFQDGPRTTDLMVVILVIIGIIVFIGIIFLILLIIWCKRKKPISRSPSPVQGTEFTQTNPNEKGGTPTSGSIGDCSLAGSNPEYDPLLGTTADGPEPPQKVTTGTNTSQLNESNEDIGTVGEDAGSNGESQTGQPDSHGINAEGGLKASVKSDRSTGSTREGTAGILKSSVKSDKSTSTKNSDSSNASSKKIDAPSVRIFTDGTDTSCSLLDGGMDNTRIQEHCHSVRKGTDVYFVPSVIDVDSLVIERKGDGRRFRGRKHDVLPNFITLENVMKKDAGFYKWIITHTVDGITNTYDGVIELFVGDLTEHTINPTADQGVIQENPQPSTVPQNLTGQHVNNVRLPPDGEEGDIHPVSGQVNPLNNGARPKVNPSGVHHTSRVVSGQPSRSVKDQPVVKTLNAETLNYLNKTEKESENDLNQFYSPRNISSGDQNLKNLSLENNLENDSVTGKELESSSMKRNLNSLLDSTICSSQNNSMQSSDTNSRGKDCVVNDSGLLSSENNEDYVSRPKNLAENINPSLISAPTLDPNSVLSTEKSVSYKYTPSGPSTMGNEKQTLIKDETDSVELPLSSTPHLHLDELSENSKYVLAENRNLDARSLTGQARSLSHLNPNTFNEGNTDECRPDPSGMVEQSVYLEPHSDDEETVVKVRYAAVRGEQAEDGESRLYQPAAQVRGFANEDVRRERNTNESSIEGVPFNGEVRAEMRSEEVGHSDEGAVGGIPRVDVGREERLANRNSGPSECKTPLKELNDSVCLEHVCNYANRRTDFGDSHSWFGLCLFYGEPRHKLEAICHARRHEIHAGPMYYVMTNLLAMKQFTVGHIVSYFSQQRSKFPEITDILINKCEDHKDCKYCKDLVQNNR